MYFVQGEMKRLRLGAVLFSCCAALMCCAPTSSAQGTHFSPPVSNVSPARMATVAPQLALDGSATRRKHPEGAKGQSAEKMPPPSSHAIQSATVTLRDGKVTVEANNSNLTQILQDMANISGMIINGLDKGPRIFGVYGPGNARDVLTDLLAGSGYNYIIVGGANEGTPRELILTAQIGNAPAIGPVHPATVPAPDREVSGQSELEASPSEAKVLGPGAVAPAPSLDEQDDNTRAQSTLQRLQHIQDQLQQQNAP